MSHKIIKERLEDKKKKRHFSFSTANFQQFDSLLEDFATSPTHDLSVQLHSSSIPIYSRLTLCFQVAAFNPGHRCPVSTLAVLE